MDKSEPALVPEWLRSSSNASHLSTSTLLHSEDRPLLKQAQHRSSLTGSENQPVLERTTSAYLHRSSTSNDSANLRSYRSYSKNQRDRDWDDISDYLDKEKFVLGNHRHHGHSHSLGKILPNKDKLLRSHSMIARKQDDTWSKNVTGNLGEDNKNRQSKSNGSFEQNYPSLGTVEKQGGIVRVSSPVLSTGIHVGNSDVTYGNSRKLSVIEAPVTGKSSAQVESPQQAVLVASPTPFPKTGLNMAEALAQGPSRAHTPPLSTAGMQRFEELAIRQAKLIPMTPTPKALAVSPSEKSKPKIGLQQNSLHLLNRTHSPVRPDTTKVSNERRLQILKPTRELNDIFSAAKETVSPTNTIKTANAPPTSASSVSAPAKSVGNSTTAAQRFPSIFSTEKRPTSQAQSRNDFFNCLKKTSSANANSTSSLKSTPEKSGESILKNAAAVSVTENGRDSSSSDFCDANGDKDHSSDVIPKLDEEEAAFLRSLGWDENGGDDEGLTEEEIRAFCEKYKTRLASSKVHPSIQPVVSTDSCDKHFGTSPCTPSSSDSESDC